MKKRKKLTKRLLAFLLTAAFMLSSLSLSAFAETTEDGSADAAAASADDGVSTAADETVSLTIGDTYEIEVSGQHSADEYSGYDSNIISVSVSVSTVVTAGEKYDSLSNEDSFYIYYKQNGTTYYLVLTYSSGNLTVSTTSDISEATLITYSSSGYLSFTSDSTTYYLGVSSSSSGPGGSSVSLTASTTASTTWSYSTNTGFSTSVTTNNNGGPSGNNESTTTTYYLSGTGLSSSASTYDYAINYSTSYTTTVTITGLAEGTTSITVGSTTYSIAVTSVYELDLSAYRGNAYVYWDMDDSNNSVYGTVTTTTDDEGNEVVDTGASAYISSVTLMSVDYTNATAQTVTNFDSTNSNFDNTGTGSEGNTGSTDSYQDGENDIGWTETAKLSSVYLNENGTAIADGTSTTAATEATATLTITPADGYYVTSVVVTCAAYVEPVNKRVSPYLCSTYTDGKAYEGTFSLSSTSDAALELSTGVSNEYFSHSGYENYTWDEDNDDSYSNDYVGSAPVVYFILITVEEIPTPAYVEYDFGDIVTYITDELGESSENYSAFSTASSWTDADTSNVYSDIDDNDTNTSYANTVTGKGGAMTDNTQFEYVYDNTDTEKDTSSSSSGYSSWKHYANSITADAIKQAAAAGYVFAGWAVTYYTNAEVASTDSGYTENTLNYNSYSITFSTDSGTSTITTMVAAGDEVTIAGHVRLVAQWIKIDSAQVIDYGLPVAVNVETALLDDADIYAITGNVTSRTSVTQTYDGDGVTTKDLEVSADVNITTDNNSTTTATGDYGTITISSTSSEDGTSTTADSSGDGSSIVYTLSTTLDGVEDFNYTVKLTYGTSTTLISNQAGTLYIIPATSMYYEESFGVTYGDAKCTSNGSSVTIYNTVKSDAGGTSGSSSSSSTGGLIDYYWGNAFWTLATSGTGDDGATTSTVGTTAQETGIVGTKDDSTYGADTYYLSSSNLGDSDGSSMYVDTSDYAASFTYTFTGTGTAIYTRTLDDSGVQEGAYIRVIIWEGDTEGTISTSDDDTTTTAEESSTNTIEAVGTWFIDTRIVDNVSDSSTLYNIPVFSYADLDYGTYTVSVLVYKEGTPVQATYTASSTDNSNNELTQLQETETSDDGASTTTYWYYQTDEDGEVLYYTIDDDGNSTEGTDNEETSTKETDYPVYYTSTSSDLTEEAVDGSTIYLTAVYVLADDTSGGDFYLDGIRIYDPLGTEDSNISSDDKDDNAWDIASAAYEDDNEANNVVINIAQKLAADAEEGYTGSDSFVTLTDYYGDISEYDPDDTADYPDNEIYLDSAVTSTDEEGNSTSTTYSVSFYLAVNSDQDTLDNYDIYLGLKAPDGIAGSVKINNTKVTVNSSADCYYLLDSYLSSTPEKITITNEDGEDQTLYAYKITITGDSGLIALTYIKITGTDEFNIAYSTDEEGTNELGTGTGTETEISVASVSTLYLLSAASVEVEDEDDTSTDEDMLDDDGMAVDPEDSDTDSGTDDTEKDDEDEDSFFEPETFTASITYLKLLRYASITVKTSSDVSYITVNGTKVTGRSSKLKSTLTFSYTELGAGSGTEYEIIAYDSDGTASEPIILTTK